MSPDEEVERRTTRALALLRRPGALITAEQSGYGLRLHPDRRRRAALAFDEAVFLRLAGEIGLKRTPAGWAPPAGAFDRADAPKPGRPGVIEGERQTPEPGGRMVRRRANLGESPIAWLARRKDADGLPWLTAVEVAAGEKLRLDFQRAGVIGRLTMDWQAGPRSGAARAGLDPMERAQDAKRRIARALDYAGPGLREMLEHVCFRGTALEAAERDLGLTRRSGKVVLKLALQRLAKHYGLG